MYFFSLLIVTTRAPQPNLCVGGKSNGKMEGAEVCECPGTMGGCGDWTRDLGMGNVYTCNVSIHQCDFTLSSPTSAPYCGYPCPSGPYPSQQDTKFYCGDNVVSRPEACDGGAGCLFDCTGLAPTKNPTTSPTNSPSSSPTKSPTTSPTSSPSRAPSKSPTSSPSASPTSAPSKAPSSSPTSAPTKSPSSSPTKSPSSSPTTVPSASPTSTPTKSPSFSPSVSPTRAPSSSPTMAPTNSPSFTLDPTQSPSKSPSLSPSKSPTSGPTKSPSPSPSSSPTPSPTKYESHIILKLANEGDIVVVLRAPVELNVAQLYQVNTMPSGDLVKDPDRQFPATGNTIVTDAQKRVWYRLKDDILELYKSGSTSIASGTFDIEFTVNGGAPRSVSLSQDDLYKKAATSNDESTSFPLGSIDEADGDGGGGFTVDENPIDEGGIIGGVVAAVFVFGALLVLFLFYRRKKQNEASRGSTNASLEDGSEGSFDSEKQSQQPVTSSATYASLKLNDKFIIKPDALVKEKKIGEGAYGSVFLGRWRNMTVAVKEVRADVDEEAKRSLLSEAEGMQQLRPHGNIVTLYGVMLAPTLAIVTEFCEKGSLDDLLYGKPKRRHNFTEEQIENVVLGTAKGVAHLHMEGVIHRDLAARNVLVDKHFGARVADFGMARKIDLEVANENQTKTAVGPLKWMAPEQMQDRKYSTASDVFAFGVVLYEIYARSLPWPGKSAVVAAQQVMNGKRMELPDAMPDGVKEIARACWAEDAKDRPTMDEIVVKLQVLFGDAPELPPDPKKHRKKKERGEVQQSESAYDRPEVPYDAPVKHPGYDNLAGSQYSEPEGSAYGAPPSRLGSSADSSGYGAPPSKISNYDQMSGGSTYTEPSGDADSGYGAPPSKQSSNYDKMSGASEYSEPAAAYGAPPKKIGGKKHSSRSKTPPLPPTSDAAYDLPPQQTYSAPPREQQSPSAEPQHSETSYSSPPLVRHRGSEKKLKKVKSKHAQQGPAIHRKATPPDPGMKTSTMERQQQAKRWEEETELRHVKTKRH